MAIYTTTLKRQLLQDLLDDFNAASNYYFVGIARSQLWNDSDIVPSVVNSVRETREFRENLQGVRLISDASFVIPRYNWTSGTIYRAWDDNEVDHQGNGFYVLSSLNHVYVCIQQGKNSQGVAVPSTVEPTGTATTFLSTGDGYVWKYMYSLDALELSRFVSSGYIPVTKIDSSDGSVREDNQASVQAASIAGQVLSIAVTDGGSGYTSAPSVSIVGDGDSATATATIYGGAVVKVEMSNRGSGYNNASVIFSSGTASARAILAEDSGMGSNPIRDLKARSVMFNGRPDGTEGGELLIDQDFRQTGLIKNIKVPLTDSDFTGTAGSALRKLTFQGGATAFTADNLVVGATSGAKAFIDYSDSTVALWYHQTDSTGYGQFQAGESLTSENRSGVTVTGSATLDSDQVASVNRYTGDILYLSNHSSVTRSSGETQDIKLIVRL